MSVQGVLQYGYGSWDEIYADESLGFPDDIGNSISPYIQRIPINQRSTR